MGWISGDKKIKWIEEGKEDVPLSVLLSVDIKHINIMKIENEWIKHTIRVWAEVKKMFGDNGSISRAMSMVGNCDFPPLEKPLNHGFRRWVPRVWFCFLTNQRTLKVLYPASGTIWPSI